VKIADFGISRVASPALWTPTGKIRGTPAYMAPEQAGGREPNYKWDIFSAGVVFYELLAGFNPFGAPDPQVALKKIAGETPPPLLRVSPTMPLDVEAIVARMLEKDPDKRYANVETILVDLQRATSNLKLDYSQEVFRDWLADAEPVNAMLRGSRSAFHLDVARKLLSQGKAFSDVALWEVYRAALSDTGNQEARAMLPQVARENGYTMQASNSMAIKAAEARLAEQPDDVKLLLQVAKLYRAEGNVLQTFYFGRSALSLAPLDPGVRVAVDKVLGPGKLQYL
jgi:serine/threonine protein kinase